MTTGSGKPALVRIAAAQTAYDGGDVSPRMIRNRKIELSEVRVARRRQGIVNEGRPVVLQNSSRALAAGSPMRAAPLAGRGNAPLSLPHRRLRPSRAVHGRGRRERNLDLLT